MEKKKITLITVITLVMAFTATFNQTLMTTALPVLMKDFSVNLNTVQWLTTGYVLVLGIITPISANLYQKYTNRQVFLTSVAVFFVGTTLGMVATNYSMLLIARLLQAAAAGINMSFMQTLLLDIYPDNKRGTVMGMVSLVISLAPAIGPSLGGLVVSLLSWRYLFILTLPITLVVWVLAYFVLPNVSETRPLKLDLISIATSSIGLGALLYGISVVATSLAMGLGLIIVGAGIVCYFVKRQLKLTTPMLDIRLLKIPSFSYMTIIALLVFGVLMGTETILPLFIENSLHQSALVAGLIMLPGAAAMGCLSPMVGSYYDRHGMKRLFYTGALVTLLSSLPFLIVSDKTTLLYVAIIYVIRLIGLCFLMSTTTTEAIANLRGAQISYGTALNGSLRQIGGSLFNTIMIAITSLSANFVLGFQWAIGFTMVVTVFIGILGIKYLRMHNTRV
ncbi:DHA2 family efflux MFS transporter permease subunit [Lactiplantibacillus paraplantarum]|uniref:DHA2 family efflux MFS transporter permease subunit n=1 Tax=Lactiplantibacillus paraplantarum TaxID=60520 RepID=UPI003DA2B9F4